MMLMKNEVISAMFVGAMVSCLTWFNTPTTAKTERKQISSLLLRSFFISFCLSYAIFYFIGDSGSDEVLDNIILSEPDF